jgi:hypothetical protein
LAAIFLPAIAASEPALPTVAALSAFSLPPVFSLPAIRFRISILVMHRLDSNSLCHPSVVLNGGEKYAARLISQDPADLRRKIFAALDLQRDEFTDPGTLPNLDSEASVRNIEDDDISLDAI